MSRYLVGRVIQAVGVVLAISLITFFILNVIPGDPVELMMGEFATPEAIAQVRAQMGLDKPIFSQYFNWLIKMFHGDFGVSYFQHKPVLSMLLNSFGYTARLALFAYILALLFGLTLKWFPISGAKDWNYYVLPAIALGTRYAASISRITRTSMLEVTKQDYMRTASAKGVHGWMLVMKHAFRNALIPVVTVAGTDLGNILTGSMLIETVFTIDGIGKLMVDAINQRDLPLVQGGVMYIATICVVIYLLVDILYAVIDPRIRLGGGAEG